jgi:hypothetical protein
MAKLPTIKRLLKEDFPGQDWIDKLLQPINLFMETMVSAFNKNITMDNLKANINTFEYTNTASIANQFSVGLGTAPKHVTVGNVVGRNGATITGPVWFTWTYDYSNDQLIINTIYGLGTANGKYDITVMVYGG